MLWPVLGMSPKHTMSAETLRGGSKKEKEMQIEESMRGIDWKKNKNGTCAETGAAFVAVEKNRRDKRRIILTKSNLQFLTSKMRINLSKR